MTLPSSRALLRSAAAFSALALLASPALAQSKAAVDALNAAAALQKGGKLDEAMAKYEQALKAAPTMFQAYANRAALQLQRVAKVRDQIKLKKAEVEEFVGRTDAAAVAALAASKVETDELAKKEAEFLKGALADYEQAIKLSPAKVELYYDRGTAYAESGEFDKALADFDEYIKRAPKDVKGYNGRGLVFFDRAKSVRDKFKSENKLDAGILASKPDFEKAIADFNKCIELDPKLDAAYQNRGASNALILEYELAIADYTKTVELNPKNQRAFRGRSEIYRALEANYKNLNDRPKEAEYKALKEKDNAEVKRLEKEAKDAADAAAAAAAPAAAPAAGAKPAAPAATPAAPKK